MIDFRYEANNHANWELRYHTVQEFNKGVYDYIIATDESGAHEQDEEEEETEEAPEAAADIMDKCRW